MVLGMHRSGTSCLTGLLQQTGLELGDVVTEAPHNKKGNRENLDIMRLNDDVLAHSRGSWDRPPEAIRWTPEQVCLRDEIIIDYARMPLWGFKDPRTLFTLPFWLDGLVGRDVKYIGTFRHPLSVAKSLHARQKNISIPDGVRLWRQYNEKLLEYRRERDFPVVCFDSTPDAYLSAFLSAVDELSLPLYGDLQKLDFFDRALVHQNPVNEEKLNGMALEIGPALELYNELREAT
jgi:hypothetical protein